MADAALPELQAPKVPPALREPKGRKAGRQIAKPPLLVVGGPQLDLEQQ